MDAPCMLRPSFVAGTATVALVLLATACDEDPTCVFQEPPAVVMSAGNGEVVGEAGGFCVYGERCGLCTLGGRGVDEYLVATPADEVSFSMPATTMVGAHLWVSKSGCEEIGLGQHAIDEDVPIALGLEPGVYLLSFSTRFNGRGISGDVSATFGLVVSNAVDASVVHADDLDGGEACDDDGGSIR